MINLIAALVLILGEAIPEGLRLSGSKTLAGIIEFMYRAIVTLLMFMFIAGANLNFGTMDDIWKVILAYVLLRYAIFDLIHNLCAELPWNFRGTTKVYDRMLAKVPDNLILFTKVGFLFWSIVWLIKY